MRLVTIEEISEIRPHPNAYKLELADILGYTCVVPKGEYKAGIKIIFIKPDTVLPKAKAWAAEYEKYAPKRVKAIKLRDEWSQGIIVPPKLVEDLSIDWDNTDEEYDIAGILGVTKFEPPAPKDLRAKSSILPFYMPVTDEENVLGIRKNTIPFGLVSDISIKVDGTSSTFYYDVESDTFGLTSRKLDLFLDGHSEYTEIAKMYKIREKLTDFCKTLGVSLALRAEVYGKSQNFKGIQSSSKNPHSAMPLGAAFFSIYNISEGKYETKGDEFYYVKVCRALELPMVNILEENVIFTSGHITKYANLETLNGEMFEGVVVKYNAAEAKAKYLYSKGSFKIMNLPYDAKK